MKTKSIFISALLAFASFMQLNAQNEERLAENVQTKPVINAENTKQEDVKSTIEFDKLKHDFGTIKESDGKVSAVFTFTNQSDSPLIIANVVASCGCSAAEWTREPVAPGEQGYIKATYDPTNRINAFNRSLTVHSNANPSKIILSIQGSAVK